MHVPRTTATLRAVVLVIAGMSLSRCSSAISPTPNVPVTRLSTNPTAFAILTGYQQPATLVIRGTDDLASAWATIYRGQTDVPPVPAVDFTREIVVGVAIGTQPTGGFDVVITGASEFNGTTTIDATVTSPGPSCVVTGALTQPVDLARIPATPAPVIFSLIQRTRSC